jgi:hypothetical protein
MTESIKALLNVVKHSVGNLSNISDLKTVNGGAVATEDIDNFTLVELGFDANGERTATSLTNKANKAYLCASPEFRPLGEPMTSFYNAEGDRVRPVILEVGYTRFDTSAYSFNTGVTSLANGQVAHFDVATKKFIISASGTPHADYAGSSAQFVVVSNEDDVHYTDGLALVRLEVSKA